jgi:radical SAM superfamily enzyme YgiQ (UPF0313 family)
MKVLLISANTEEINMRPVPWGLGCVVSACRKAGHEAMLLDLLVKQDGRAAVTEAIEDFAPEVIGISVRNIDDQNRSNSKFILEKVKQVVEACRERSQAPLVLGGAGYSIFPQSALEFLGADMGIQGEGEDAFPALLGRLERRADPTGVPGLYVRDKGAQGERKFVRDLNTLPLPGEDLLTPYSPAKEELWVPLQARRGCAMNCSYCSTAVIEGGKVRVRSAEQVVEWMAKCARSGFQKFFFVDNAFNIPPSLGLEICRQMVRRGLNVNWRCILNPFKAKEKLVAAMAEAGCVEVSLGFESGCEHILRMMNKKFTVNQIRRAAKLLADHGIRRMGFLLLGGPGETVESVEESLAFADSLNLEALRVTAGIRIYPGTRLADIAIQEGVVRRVEDLLFPAFYLAEGLDERLPGILAQWKSTRSHWIF